MNWISQRLVDYVRTATGPEAAETLRDVARALCDVQASIERASDLPPGYGRTKMLRSALTTAAKESLRAMKIIEAADLALATGKLYEEPRTFPLYWTT